MNRSASFLFAFLSICCFASCGPAFDLTGISTFSQTTALAGVSFAAIAADYADSCRRFNELSLTNPALLSLPPTPDTIDAIVAASPSPVVKVRNAPGFGTCTDANLISSEWDRHNRTILAYIHTLGAIATVDVRPTLSPLTDSLETAKILTKDQDDAFQTLAKHVADAVISGKQRVLLAKLILEADLPMHRSIESLKAIAMVYEGRLTLEYNQAAEDYHSYIYNQVYSSPKPSPIPTALFYHILLDERPSYDAKLKQITDRSKAALEYVSVLEDIEQQQVRLAAVASRQGSLAEYGSLFRQDVVPLIQDVEALRSLEK